MRIMDWSSDVCSSDLLIVSALLALITWMDAITPLLLLCFTLAVGCGTALNAPAWQASVRLQVGHAHLPQARSEEHTSELQSLMRISYAVFCLKKKKKPSQHHTYTYTNRSLHRDQE